MADQRATSHSYAVIAPPSAARMIALAIAATVGATGLALALAHNNAGNPFSPALWMATCAAALALGALCLLQWRRSVALEAGVLVIKAGLNTRRVPASSIELERARIIDLQQRAELLPGRKTLGASLPGYQTGWFRTRQWGKGFYLLTARERVLWLPERDGPHLLLSLQQPQALLAALNAMAPRRDPG